MSDNAKSSIFSFTTLPRSKRSSKAQDTNNNRNRGLASLNIINSEAPPVPPPRSRRATRHKPEVLKSMPGVCESLYKDSPPPLPTRTTSQSQLKPCYAKYELKRTTLNKDRLLPPYVNRDKSTCDIIQSSQHPRPANDHHPDLLESSYRADRRGMPTSTTTNPSTITTKPGRISVNHKDSFTRRSDMQSNSNTRFVFYKPASSTSNPNGDMKMGYNGNKSQPNGGKRLEKQKSFDNPAFSLVDNEPAPPIPQRVTSGTRNEQNYGLKSKVKIKPNALPSKTIYSTVGSPYSLKTCDSPVPKSPLSAKFRKSFSFREVPVPEPEVVPKTTAPPATPQSLKPILSARKLETCLKQYSTTNRTLSPVPVRSEKPGAIIAGETTAFDNMMKYYGMKPMESPPLPEEGKLHRKTGSPYSSSSSLNGTGETVEVIMRRKKKLKIRSPSLTSDDGESVKRVSLEINLQEPVAIDSTTETSSSRVAAAERSTNKPGTLGSTQRPFAAGQASLSQSIENLSLDDLTTTETARYLKKQFTKLKTRANSLRVKDNELKQRFVQLQHRRGKVCGGGGGVTKTRGRMSPTPVGYV